MKIQKKYFFWGGGGWSGPVWVGQGGCERSIEGGGGGGVYVTQN